MLGCRALSPKEVQSIASELSLRNRCIFILGIRTGFRIREILSLNISDVIDERDKARETVKVQSKSVKGKTGSQAVPMHSEAKALILEYLGTRTHGPSEPLFTSNCNAVKGTRLHHSVFRKALKDASRAHSIRDGHLVSTHSLRKTYAARMNEALGGNLFKLQKAMRHKNINSTAAYVSVDESEIFDAIKKAK